MDVLRRDEPPTVRWNVLHPNRSDTALIVPGEDLRALESWAWDANQQLEGAVEAERDWCERIIAADQRADERVLATLAAAAAARLAELGGR